MYLSTMSLSIVGSGYEEATQLIKTAFLMTDISRYIKSLSHASVPYNENMCIQYFAQP